MMRLISLTTLCFFFVIAASATAETPAAESLFDGETLDRWEVLTCDVEVVDGAILIKGGNGILLADRQYGDFILQCDWKALDPNMWDSGIYFRCALPPRGRPWPTVYQVNMRKGMEGALGGAKQLVTKNPYKPGEWNHFKLTLRGRTAELEFNGIKVWTHEGIETEKGHLCLQSEVPGGGQFLFKNITIVDLDRDKKPE